MRYYLMSIGLIVPLIMALMCSITSTTVNSPVRWDGFALSHLRCAGGGHPQPEKGRDSADLNKEGSGDNITNHMLWNMMLARRWLPFWRRRWVIWQRHSAVSEA